MRRWQQGLLIGAAVAAWGLAVFFAQTKSAEPAAVGADATGEQAMKSELHDIKKDVLGGSAPNRGSKVVGGVLHARDEDMEFSPREVCLKMKLENPEQNKALDCSRKEYDSPNDWNDR
jgi:hypothetical protein